MTVLLRTSPFNMDPFALIPQPMPPRISSNPLRKPGQQVSLNPQPLPPKPAFLGFLRPPDYVTLNPQPLPPRDIAMFQPVRFFPRAIR